jgi:hypothetical protein
LIDPWLVPFAPQYRKFRKRYERDMIERRETSFLVGTMHQYPSRWIVVGLFYPQKPNGNPGLFDG